jgi:hypothetical protein
MLLNWHVLASRKGQLRLDTLVDGLNKAEAHNCDVLLGTELGATIKTQPLESGLFESDWSHAPKVKPGQGVGAFFHHRWQNRWLLVQIPDCPINCRFYVLNAATSQLLVGVFYAPHSGHLAANRIAYYRKFRQCWSRACAQFPNALKVLAGDANLPGLLFSSPREVRASNEVEHFFCDSFLSDMHVANCLHGSPTATHKKGGVLDLVLVDDRAQNVRVQVDCSGISGSDHYPVLVSFQWAQPPDVANSVVWHPRNDMVKNQLQHAIQPHLRTLHHWMQSQLQKWEQGRASLSDTLDEATTLMGITILGELWQCNSPFGHFSSSGKPARLTQWWNTECKFALAHMRKARGTPKSDASRKAFKSCLLKARSSHWRKFVAKGESMAKASPSTSRKLHKFVKRGIRKARRTSAIIQVGSSILNDSQVRQLWPAYLEAQVSWQGPCKAEELWSRLQDGVPIISSPDEFDDEAAKRTSRVTRKFLEQAVAHTRCQGLEHCFHFSELCDAQADMNEEAATSPIEGLPIAVALQETEEGRAVLLGLLNMAYISQHLPWIWRLVPIIPVLKPGKPAGNIDGHRPISLMAAIFKLWDKLLHLRLWPAIQKAVLPWQGGGTLGADIMAWTLAEILRIRRSSKKDTFIAFLDGESAFCRPPATVVLEALGQLESIGWYDWLAVRATLLELHGTACILGSFVGEWRSITGLAQGGALSQALFVLVVKELFDELVKAKCGIHFVDAQGISHHTVLLAYIDDLVLFAETRQQFRKALSIARSWAQKVRMRFNIGSEKSAVMVMSASSVSNNTWRLGDQVLPLVDLYKYCGVLLSCSGSWDPFLNSLREKSVARTGELVRWARAYGITVDLVQRLWAIYVETSAAWGLGLTMLTKTQELTLNRIQRKAGRLLLGHSRRSPIPSTCLELGWWHWASHAKLLRLRLLRRILLSDNMLVISVASASSTLPGSMVSQSVDVVRSCRAQGLPTTNGEWSSFLDSWMADARQCDGEELWNACLHHNNLASFRPGPWLMEGSLSINRFLHDHAIDRETAHIISRLFCGGQGLRGGDPRSVSAPSRRTACFHCLLHGRRVKETLYHFMHVCPLYTRVRQQPRVAVFWAKSPDAVTLLHRDQWNFRGINLIIRTVKDMWDIRASMLETEGAANRRGLTERISHLWEQCQ